MSLDNATKAHMEPGARAHHLHIEMVAQVSIAISLKRIADFLCGGKDRDGSYHMDVVAYLSREICDVLDR